MPTAKVNGVNLFYEEAGEGTPLVFVHEFAGEARSWHLQVRFFARRYRTIAYNARGYPPSDVPEDPKASSRTRPRTTSAGSSTPSASRRPLF